MSAATASIADVSGTVSTNKDDSRDRRKSGQTQAQCTARPLPALGTQRIIQGNGTTVGTVISLQCPAKHKLVGRELMCVMDTNSPHWVGDTYCKPVSPFDDHGFRVAVLASIVSLAIIFFMSVAFITCCLLDCMKEDKRKNHERESEMWQWEEQAQHQGDSRSRYSHKGRNNNNNTQDKVQSLWDTRNPDMCDNMRACRCHQQYAYGPACTYGPTPPLSTLPGYGYDQPLLPRGPGSAQISGPPEYNGRPLSRQTTNPGPVQVSAAGPGLVWQYGGQQSGLSGRIPSTTDESSARNVKPAKEFSIRIISV
ncbi:sushi domain-containing protein 3 isoform X2 [Anarrhichthys ocellatus]|uniref:sushi domain-containing protein 3 isoform X2 n=1 Tax=Anarrhichthys ocellatus TaxID=433405 RepID=UPI0012EDC979|nr:sushi domain-containing protein 3-like isoform X2 [Anarrhichthys ocellatus]